VTDVKKKKMAKSKGQPVSASPTTVSLACGCRASFRPGTEGSPVLVVIDRKAEACGISLHVAGLPVYDRRSALRPPTRFGPPLQPDYEDG